MGSAFHELIYSSHSQVFPGKYALISDDAINRVGANVWRLKRNTVWSLKGAEWENDVAKRASVLFAAIPCYCCAEDSPSSILFPQIGTVRGNFIAVRGNKAKLQVAKCLEQAENGILEAIDGVPVESEEDASISSSISTGTDDAPLERSIAGAVQVPGNFHTERGGDGERYDIETSTERSAVAGAIVVSEVAEATHAKKSDRLQSLESAATFAEEGLLQQMRDIVMFAGPALGIWLSGPIMSLIDTAVVGYSSSLELAALGPGTVFCDQVGYVFMFLSVATSNLIATSLAKQDKTEAAHRLSRLLFVALTCGLAMLLLTGLFSRPLLEAFVGPQNVGLVPAACLYVQIRGLAWPAILVGMVAQSASLGMQDSWGPLKVLAVASLANASGDILLCTCLGCGIAGAAWATMVSQYIGGYLMLSSLNRKGYNALALSIPSLKELIHMIELAAPVLLARLSKVFFYSYITFLSTSLGAVTLAAHQVMIGLFSALTVCGEPLSQTAQAFMPAFIHGLNRNLKKAQTLLRSLLLIGALCGVVLAFFTSCFYWILPQAFTNDKAIISQAATVTVSFLCGLVVTPPLLILEGTLLAARDLKFLSLSMVSCVVCSSALLLVVKELGFGLQGFWWAITCFQSMRFFMAFGRLTSAKSVLKDPKFSAEQNSPHAKLA